MSVDWAALPCVSFDVETTGVDVFTDRIVQAAVVKIVPGQDPVTKTWLVDPGIEIPDEAAAVHGITTDRARAEATHTPPQMLLELTSILTRTMQLQWPLVVMNAPFDLTMLEAENERYSVPSMAGRVAPLPIGPIVDPMVLDKAADPFRRSCYKAPGCDPEAKVHECGGCRGPGREIKGWTCGGCGALDRKLTSLCAHYGVQLTAAHDAGADALAAAQLFPRIIATRPSLFKGLTLGGLHVAQVEWKRDQMRDLAKFFRGLGETEKAESCSPDWPLQQPRDGAGSTTTPQEQLIP